MNPFHDLQLTATRRTFLGATAGAALGSTALSALLGMPAGVSSPAAAYGSVPLAPHFPPKAKRVLCLFQAEGFSHVDLFDNKPSLEKFHGQDIPPSVKGNQRLT